MEYSDAVRDGISCSWRSVAFSHFLVTVRSKVMLAGTAAGSQGRSAGLPWRMDYPPIQSWCNADRRSDAADRI